jgi:uncharacterized protein involved in exopolysaccharide biosynthesis
MNPSMQSTFSVPQILLRGWWSILLCAAIGAGIAALYALRAPNWYRARISVVPLQTMQPSDAEASRPPAGKDALLGAAQRVSAVLSSTSVADEVIEKFDLEHRYGAHDIDAARTELWNHCGPKVDPRSGIVSLTCEDKDPRIAMEMAAQFGEVGNRAFGRVSASRAREERTFLETQVATIRHDVDEASRKLREFERANKIIDLPAQSKAVISAMASLKGEILSKQLELSYQASFASDSESSVTQLRKQIGILTHKLRQLEVANTDASSDFFPAAGRVADMRFELEQLVREQKIQETLFFNLTQRYETAKVDEARDTSTFQVLDQATLPANPCRPRRMRIAMVGGFVGLAIACVSLLVAAWWRRQATPPNVA